MDFETYKKILTETAFVRTSGTAKELRCANYLADRCRELGLEPHLEAFPVDMAEMEEAVLLCDGVSIPCTGYLNAGCGEVEAPLYYLANDDAYALSQCRGKIVLSDKGMTHWHYQDMVKAGALGFITYSGNIHFPDHDLEQKELRRFVHDGVKIPGVNIHTAEAIELMRKGVKTAKIVLKQKEFEGHSHNLIVDLPGEVPEKIVFSAHYDSTPLSVGTWDNMSGSVGILALAEHFSQHPHRLSMRFVWCGSEERGLLGSKAYVAAHKEELDSFLLNINLDMIGSIMGPQVACCTAEDKLVHYMEYFASEIGVSLRVSQGVYPSDSTPFADGGVPAVTFARDAQGHTATIHNRYDTIDILKMEHMQEDIDLIAAFADRMANAKHFPVSKEMPENMKQKLDEYLLRKRPEQK